MFTNRGPYPQPKQLNVINELHVKKGSARVLGVQRVKCLVRH